MSEEYTPEQHASVDRVMKLKHTDYYGILRVEKKCTSAEIKRAYKKQALLMHPDKNKAPNADEAFKRIAKAFQVLSDEDKRRIFDQTGADPDSRAAGMAGGPGFGASPFGGGHPFGGAGPFGSGFARAAPADDIFAQFFGGPSMGQPQFQFQFGGDPSDIFSNLFGEALFGGRQRTAQTRQRQRAARDAEQERRESQNYSTYLNLLIIAAVLILPSILSWLFESNSGSSLPKFRFSEQPPFTMERQTPKYNIPFFVNPKDTETLSDSKLRTLDLNAENRYVSITRSQCTQEYLTRQQLMQDATGWLFTDQDAYEEAKNMPLPHCDILSDLGIRLR